MIRQSQATKFRACSVDLVTKRFQLANGKNWWALISASYPSWSKVILFWNSLPVKVSSDRFGIACIPQFGQQHWFYVSINLSYCLRRKPEGRRRIELPLSCVSYLADDWPQIKVSTEVFHKCAAFMWTFPTVVPQGEIHFFSNQILRQ